MTTAGQLRDRITIQKMGGGFDEWGTPLPNDWADHVKLWANVRHLSGASAIKADADTSTVRASIRIRRRADIDASMRVVFGSAVYAIEAVLPDERRVFVDLVCKQVT